MKVILTDDVKTLGKRGAVIDVADGYARNFLLPKRLAVKATNAAVEHENERLRLAKIREEKLLGEAKVQAAKLEGKTIKVTSKAGDQGKLYGTITSKEIAAAIQEQLKFEVDKKKVHVDDSIKTVGDHSVSFKLHPEVTVTLNLKVEAE